MSIDTEAFRCSCCGCVLYPGDPSYEIKFGEFVCEPCFRTLLEERAKKAEAAAQEKKSRKFWFFGRRKNQKGDK